MCEVEYPTQLRFVIGIIALATGYVTLLLQRAKLSIRVRWLRAGFLVARR